MRDSEKKSGEFLTPDLCRFSSRFLDRTIATRNASETLGPASAVVTESIASVRHVVVGRRRQAGSRRADEGGKEGRERTRRDIPRTPARTGFVGSHRTPLSLQNPYVLHQVKILT